MQAFLFLLSALGAQAAGVEGPEAIPKAPRPAEPPRVVPRRVYPPPYTPPARPPSQPIPVWLFVGLAMLPAIFAAKRQQKQRREEEETKTPYTEEDLMNDFEFKILRDPLGRFSRENFRSRILQEESAAGWQLVEVFDGGRLRLKRVKDLHASAVPLPTGYDPYRLALRAPPGYNLYMGFGGLLAVAGGVLLMLGIVFSVVDTPARGWPPLLLVFGLLAGAVAAACFIRGHQTKRQ